VLRFERDLVDMLPRVEEEIPRQPPLATGEQQRPFDGIADDAEAGSMVDEIGARS
jgi:hypothetical protein